MKNIKNLSGKRILLPLLWFVLNSIDFSQLQLNDMKKSVLMGRVLMSLLDSLILCWVLVRSSKGVALLWLGFSLPLLMQLRSKFSAVMVECSVFGAPVVVVFARKSRSPLTSLMAS